MHGRTVTSTHTPARRRNAYTMLELLVTIGIVSFLASVLGVTISNMLEIAKETQTVSTLQRLDGLVLERQKALERFFQGPEFRRIVDRRQKAFDATVPGLPRQFVEIMTRKQFTKYYLPQSFSDFIAAGEMLADVQPALDTDLNGIPDKLESISGVTLANHKETTESAELLYFAVTQLDVFGTAPVGIDDFSRWPTRLFKPYGQFGPDGRPGAAGNDDNGDATYTDFISVPTGGGGAVDIPDGYEVGWPLTDDVIVTAKTRNLASIYFAGLPKAPPVSGQYDLLNSDPDDPYGLIVSTAGTMSQTGIDVFAAFPAAVYHDLDTFHKPLILSAGPDGEPGLFEPTIVPEDFPDHFEASVSEFRGNQTLDAAKPANALTFGYPYVVPAEDMNRNGMLDIREEDIDG
ncbi:MAG: pilus assembly FimT family protein, partial [Planctomycetota bacterium]